jgi:hypothetical protein
MSNMPDDRLFQEDLRTEPFWMRPRTSWLRPGRRRLATSRECDLAETTAYRAGAKIFRVPACRCEIVDPRPLMSPPPAVPTFTPKQSQHLAFIYAYTGVLGRPPAEADLQRHFGVSPPSVHQMVLTLERDGMIRRQPGVPRSIEVLLAPELLPILRRPTRPRGPRRDKPPHSSVKAQTAT